MYMSCFDCDKYQYQMSGNDKNSYHIEGYYCLCTL
jgi:hypothetical protein